MYVHITRQVSDNTMFRYSKYCVMYSSFGTWWHTVTHVRGSEGETGKWSG